jgi:hypothetical protein
MKHLSKQRRGKKHFWCPVWSTKGSVDSTGVHHHILRSSEVLSTCTCLGAFPAHVPSRAPLLRKACAKSRLSAHHCPPVKEEGVALPDPQQVPALLCFSLRDL